MVELNQLIGERDTAANGDVDLFVQKSAEVQIKEMTVTQMRDQLARADYGVLSATDFKAWRTELFTFTREQLGDKYHKVKELLDAAAVVLDEIDQISYYHADTYAMLEHLTYGKGKDTGMDADGVRYDRAISFQHRMPAVLHDQLQTDAIGTVKSTLVNMIELDQYI